MARLDMLLKARLTVLMTEGQILAAAQAKGIKLDFLDNGEVRFKTPDMIRASRAAWSDVLIACAGRQAKQQANSIWPK